MSHHNNFCLYCARLISASSGGPQCRYNIMIRSRGKKKNEITVLCIPCLCIQRITQWYDGVCIYILTYYYCVCDRYKNNNNIVRELSSLPAIRLNSRRYYCCCFYWPAVGRWTNIVINYNLTDFWPANHSPRVYYFVVIFFISAA